MRLHTSTPPRASPPGQASGRVPPSEDAPEQQMFTRRGPVRLTSRAGSSEQHGGIDEVGRGA